MADPKRHRDVPSPVVPSELDSTRVSGGAETTDPTRLTDRTAALPDTVPGGPASLSDRAERAIEQTEQHVRRGLSVEEELLAELRRMNHQLGQITHGYRRYTLSFFSGVVRGLGAALGATVVFAIFIAAFSRLDTTPIIGNYVRQIVSVVKQSAPGSAKLSGTPFLPTPTDTAPDGAATASPAAASSAEAAVSAPPAASPAASGR